MKRLSLSTLLLLFIPVAIALFALNCYMVGQRKVAAAEAAVRAMEKLGKVFDLDGDLCVEFRNANVTDADVKSFLPAFDGDERRDFVVIDLKGSPVSPAALAELKAAAPNCHISP